MTRTQLLTGLVVIAVLLLGVAAYFVFTGGGSSNSESASSAGNMGVRLERTDHTLGSPKAPLTVLEYAAPTCPHCAHFDMDIFPQFKQQYIDTGKVFFIFRVFPLNAWDVAAAAVARCLPEDNFFQFLDLLYRNQPKWDPEYQVPDPHAGLVDMGRIAGLSEQQVDGCIADQSVAKQIVDVGNEAQTKYSVSGTPTFIIDGQEHGPFGDFQDLKAYLDPILAKKK